MSRSRREHFGELAAFAAVAEEESFTRAASRLGLSTAALTRTIQSLEARLGAALLERTTRSVALTDAGRRLQALAPQIDALERNLAGLSRTQVEPAGRVRIAASREAAAAWLWPALGALLGRHPGIEIELIVDAEAQLVLGDRFDAVVVAGAPVEKGTAAIRIGPDRRMALVASPSYLSGRPLPKSPQDLANHACIDSSAAWTFGRDGAVVEVRPAGRLRFNDAALALRAALDGFGLAYLLEDQVAQHVGTGRLVRLLTDWCMVLPGFHLQYRKDRPLSPAMAALVAGLRHDPAGQAPRRPHFVGEAGVSEPARSGSAAFAGE